MTYANTETNTAERREILSYMFDDYACYPHPWFPDVNYDDENYSLSITVTDPDHPDNGTENLVFNEQKIVSGLDSWSKFILNLPTPDRFSAKSALAVKIHDWDDFDYDVIIADSIVQFIVFDEIRYA